jgi:hypothetical protein
MISAYPLSWPEGWKRTAQEGRVSNNTEKYAAHVESKRRERDLQEEQRS